MVFESLVADILNRFLGSYVDNLNASQLNIGIWGGDVKLNNLDIKETALDELDLPVKLKFGYVKSLVLKIPWKNLYTEPTIVNISQLYLIIVPNQGIVYNEEKARKNELEAKQKKLTRLEENRQNRIKKHTNTDDTFTEKLVAQVIKNLQIRIKQVHLRYEDKFSNRDRPFATGVTLDSLDFQTTDENFKLTIQREAVKIFYKLIEMNNFSVYSNANSGLLSDLTDKNAIIEALQNSIATREKRPEGYKYVLEPLSVEAQLKLNQKPEADGSDWTTPKIELSTELNKLALAIGKFQYQDFLLFLEAQERFTISERYIKYRPNLTLYKEHYKEWWHFAYNCILNEQVKRRRDNWSWERMKRHTKMVRQYKDAWITFRTEKNPRTSVKETIEEAEQKLDVFNLNIARQQAEFEIDRNEDLVRVEDQPQQGWVGWAKSWFGGGAKKAEHSETDAKIMEKLEQAVTPEEKQRLFEAIDYQENTPPTDYPKEYIENIFNLTLETVVVALEDILELKFDELSAKLEQRPSANALKFDSCIKKLEMHAVDEQRRRAQSILTMTEFNKPWLCMQFETNPLEGGFDQSIGLKIAPVILKYHAPAVNKALDVFKPPESVRLHQLTALAIARYEDVKSRSATALQHMVEERKKLKMEIQIDPAIIVLSAGGIFNESKPALIAELGQLKLKTMDHASEKAYQHIKDGKMRSLMAKAYDNFQLSLSNVQLIFSDAFNSCMQARSDRYSCHHLLKPTGMTVDLMRSTIDDIQLPLIRLFGELPDVVLMISDDRLVKLLELINSIPRPEFEEEIVDLSAPVEVQSTKLRDRAKMMAIMEVNELEEVSLHQQKMDESGESEPPEKKRYKKEENYEEEETSPLLREKQIQLDMNLILNEVGIIVNTRNRPFLSAHIRHLGLNMRKRMFDMVVQAHLGSLTLEMPKIDGQGESLYLIDNEMREGGDHLIEMTYKQATDESPTFKTEFSSNEQSIDFFFHILNFNLHKEVLNELKNFNDRLQKKLARVPPPQIAQQPQPAMSTKKRTPSQSSRRSRDSSLDRKSVAKKKPTTAKPTRPGRQKKFVFKFVMHEIAAKLYAKQNDISGGIDSSADEEAILEFCAVNIQKLNLNGRMMEDGSINVDIGLNAFTMDDRRKNAKIQRLMDKKDAKSNDKFITIKYNQNTSGDKFVDVLSSKFFLMLAPEFLGVLSSFFIFHADEEEDEGIEPADIVFATPTRQNGQRASVQQKQQTGSGGTNTIVAAAHQTYAKTSPDQIIPPTAAVGTLTLNCKIYAIEVILIENSLKPDDSQAMVLYFDAIVDAKNVDGIQQMKGGIQHLKVYSTYFAKEKRHLSNYPILKELDIVFNGSVDEKKHTQNFSVSMDQVAIRVSPSVIRLLCAVSEQFTQHQKKDQAARTARAALREYADYWKPKAIEYDKFWWFKVRDSSSPEESLIDEIAEDAKNSKDLATNQQANFSINRFVITVEAGSRDFTRPMILLESVLKGSAQNWSNQLMADAEARLQISYYNEAFNIWEPVIEPVLHQHTGWQSWQLRLKIGPEEEELLQQEPSTSKAEDRKDSNAKKRVLPPKMAVRIEACEVMNITITKSLLLLINQLKESFEKAAKQITPPISRQLPGTSSYLLLNDTGLPIKVKNTETLKANIDQKPVECTMGTFIPMERIESEKANGMSEMKGGNWQMTEDQRQVELYLQLAQPETERTVNILRAEIQCIDLPKEADSGKKWVLIVDTRLENARHVVTLRSLVNFVNHLDMPIEIRSIKDMQPTNCGVVKKGAEESLNIHLPQLYTPNGEFEMRPEGDAYDWSNKFSWHDFDSIRRRTVRCDDRANVKGGIFVEIVVEEEKIRKGARSQECHTYTIHLFPPIHLINTLPVEINILEPTKQNVQRGDGIDLFNLISGIPFVFTLQYGTETYKVQMLIPTASNRGDLQVIEMHSMSTSKKLYLGIAWSCEFLRTTMTLYTPYWMVNETGKEIVYKGPSSQNEEKNKKAKPCFSCCCEISKCCKAFCHRREINQEEQYDASIHHLATENPRFLPLAKSDFLEKKTAKLRFMDSEWSPDFPLDIAGSSGRITCQSADREYEVTVDVQLCQSGLTKVVTISPFYLLQNDSKVAIEVREPNRIDQWITVPSHSVIGFWPQQKNKRKTLIARFANSIEESIQFPFTESFEGFARITNDLIGIYVIVSLSDDSSVIHMEQFVPGMSPAILMNATDIPVEYWQSGIGEKKRTLEPGKFVPFAWDDIVLEKSTDIPRIEWNSGEGSGSDVLQHNRDQSYLPSRTSTYHYCVSFLNGRQRVFLFTSDSTVSFLALQAYEMEQPNMEIEFRLHSLGISLVNNMESKEVIYMAISTTNSSKDGFWMQYRQTDHQTTLWVKLHNFQIDNQLPSAVFPCLLGMVPQPKSVVKNEPKPFLELSFVMNQSEHTKIAEIKLLDVLVQEFAIRLDQSVINEIIDLLPKESIETDYNKELYLKDMELTSDNLNKRALQTRVTQAKAYYERMHISPLMIHLSFSQGHKDDKKGEAGLGIQWEFLNLMLKSVGVTLTEIQDVTFKLAFFERQAKFYNRNQLTAEIQSHYIRQFIKQAYVLVLGLDIIGNPYGLIRDLTSGIEDFFYQPIQGAVTGPSEFVEGMTLGLHSLFSHSVGGVLGVASRITGTLGKGVAALTLDEEYQRKRLQARQKPTNLGEGIFRGVRGVSSGVFEGVTGVVSKPLEGAKKGGLAGLIKGTGKGLIGAVVRPVSGVVDLATTMADSVKTVVANVDGIKAIRPPRVFSNDKIVRPFVYEEAIGYKIFKEINKGDFAETDHFLTYGFISKHTVIVVTDKHVIEARQHELTKNWNADWCPTYPEMNKPEWINPDSTKFGVKISLKEARGGVLQIFGSSKPKGKMILFTTENIGKRVYERMLNAWESAA